ncbi:putative phosphomannomutase [Helianthus annuus]|nr:putative phosphomannomutase [Helianthus annuus]KAJ0927355.1 putative phosphomannomutase [Helianthus annuus]
MYVCVLLGLVVPEKPLEGFHIIVDTGNRVGKVLEPLGDVTYGNQFLEPDGNKLTDSKLILFGIGLTQLRINSTYIDRCLGLFPNHIPNPEDKAAMKVITQAVLDNKVDLGIIFDMNVDRSVVVDSTGHEFNRNRLMALMSAIVLEENSVGEESHLAI